MTKEIQFIQEKLLENPSDIAWQYLLAVYQHLDNQSEYSAFEFIETNENATIEIQDLMTKTALLFSQFEFPINTSSKNTSSKVQSTGFQVLEGGLQETSFLPFGNKENTLKLKDIVGLDSLKNFFQRRFSSAKQYTDIYKKFGRQTGNGVILYGPPGCGKHMIVQAVANEYNLPIVTITPNQIVEPFFGQSAKNLHELFEEAREEKNAIVLIDNIEAIAVHRSKGTPEVRQIVEQFALEIDENQKSENPMFIIGITSMIQEIDPMFRTYGRLDQTFFVAPPNEQERALLLEKELADKPTDSIDYDELSKKLLLFTPADILTMIDRTIDTTIDTMLEQNLSDGILTQDDFIKSSRMTIPTSIEWLRYMSNYVMFANQSGIYNEIADYLQEHTDFLSTNN